MNRAVLLGVSCALLAGVGTLTALSVADPPRRVYREPDLPFEIRRAGPTAKPKRGADKRIRFEQKVSLKLDGEKTETALSLKAEHRDPSDGGQLTLRVTSAQKTSTFSYSPSTNTISLTSGGGTVAITKDPDGGYTVDGGKASSGKEALAALTSKAAYRETPRAVLLAAYASAQTPLPEVKAPVDTGTSTSTRAASSPAVCVIFKDLCDCIACDASGKGASCNRCK